MKKITFIYLLAILGITTLTAQTQLTFESGVVTDYFDHDTNLFTVDLRANFDPGGVNASSNISNVQYQNAATGNDGITLKINPVSTLVGSIVFDIYLYGPKTNYYAYLYNDAVGTSQRLEISEAANFSTFNEWETKSFSIIDMIPIGGARSDYNRLTIFIERGVDQGTFQFGLDNVTVQPHLLSNTRHQDFKFEYYPNPVSNNVQLNSERPMNEIKLFNTLGQEVLSKNINASQFQLNISDIKSGLYFLEVYGDNSKKTVKILKK